MSSRQFSYHRTYVGLFVFIYQESPFLIYKKRSAQDAHCNCSGTDTEEKRKEEKYGTIYRAFVDGDRACDGCIRSAHPERSVFYILGKDFPNI